MSFPPEQPQPSQPLSPVATVNMERYHERILAFKRGRITRSVAARIDQLLFFPPVTRPWTLTYESCRVQDDDDDAIAELLRHAASARIASLTVRFPAPHANPLDVPEHREAMRILNETVQQRALAVGGAVGVPPAPAGNEDINRIASAVAATIAAGGPTDMLVDSNGDGGDPPPGNNGDGGPCPRQLGLIRLLFQPENYEQISKTLQHLAIGRWRIEKQTLEIVQQYLANTNIKELHLDDCTATNMGQHLSDLFANSKYRPTALELGGLEDEAENDSVSISSVMSQWSELKRLQIRSSNLSVLPGLDQLTNVENLELVKMGRPYMYRQGNGGNGNAHSMLQMMTVNLPVPWDLAGNTGVMFSLTLSGLPELLCRPDCHLIDLDLQYSKIAEACLVTLFSDRGLGSNSSVQRLNLDGVALQRGGSFDAMTNYVLRQSRLRKLLLGGRAQVTAEWIQNLERALREDRNVHLECLSLGSTSSSSIMLFRLDPYLVRNWAGGKRLWSLPRSLWPKVLSRVHSQAVEELLTERGHRPRSAKVLCVDAMFTLLRQGVGRGMI